MSNENKEVYKFASKSSLSVVVVNSGERPWMCPIYEITI